MVPCHTENNFCFVVEPTGSLGYKKKKKYMTPRHGTVEDQTGRQEHQ